MRILVTGYGGFLGSEITRQLISRGDEVVGFGRGTYPHLAHFPHQAIQGDIRFRDDIIAAMEGVDGVIHTAAIAGVWGSWDTYYSINTQGTLNVIEGCRQKGVRFLVHCSSPSVTFGGDDQSGIDESAPYPQKWLCHYPHTKALAEQAVLAAHDGKTLCTAALRPHLIWGVGDPHLFPRLLERARKNRLRIIGEGNNKIDTVHVVNAAAAHLDALDALTREAGALTTPGDCKESEGSSGASHSAGEKEVGVANSVGGRAYFITQGEPVVCWDWLRRIVELAGLTLPPKRLRFDTAWRIGHALEILYRLGRVQKEPPMTRFVAAQLAKDHYFDISAARQQLGYTPRISTEEGLAELARAWAGN